MSPSGSSTSSSGGLQPHKMTYSQRKTVEKEDEEYAKMFQLFDSKAEIEYLHSYEDDKLAASVYGDAKSSSTRGGRKGKSGKSNASQSDVKPHTSGYDFDELLKNDSSWRQM
jgi:hypothetical protein